MGHEKIISESGEQGAQVVTREEGTRGGSCYRIAIRGGKSRSQLVKEESLQRKTMSERDLDNYTTYGARKERKFIASMTTSKKVTKRKLRPLQKGIVAASRNGFRKDECSRKSNEEGAT